MTAVQLALAEPEHTDRLGQVLAQTLPAGAGLLLFLHGDLGAGKSSLARALLRALGVSGPVRSPTYTLIERHVLADGAEAAHLDLYRIADPGELDFLGIDELPTLRLALVEWPERGAGLLPPPDLRLQLQIDGAGRRAQLDAGSARGAEWLVAMRAAVAADPLLNQTSS